MIKYPLPVRRGLADHVVEHLVAAIARGDHPPDSQLPPEGRLAELFEVSRLTVREAVKTLRNKGVVRVEQGRGTFVNQPAMWSPLDPDLLMARAATVDGTRDLAAKLTEARRLVEVGVAGLAANRRSDNDLGALKRSLERMRRCSDRDDADGFNEADLEFHDVIIAAAGNPFITALFAPLVDLLFEVRRAAYGSRDAREVAVAAHGRILDAIAAGSADEASAAMDTHMHETALRLDEVIGEEGLRIALAPPPQQQPQNAAPGR
jgi:GntR family transcriptional regulator, transcriptional repressor for pyruvate dehydrogenase complex